MNFQLRLHPLGVRPWVCLTCLVQGRQGCRLTGTQGCVRYGLPCPTYPAVDLPVRRR